METLEEKVKRVLADEIFVVPYDPAWPRLFEEERLRLLDSVPKGIIRRIEHYGSTSVPGLCAKPVVDLLVEVSSGDEAREIIAPILEAQGCDCFWRPLGDENKPPFYEWAIRRAPDGRRSHHIHMAEKDFILWDNLLFRDWLRSHPEDARAYGELKMRLAMEHPRDRIAYTKAKGEFIRNVMKKANAALQY